MPELNLEELTNVTDADVEAASKEESFKDSGVVSMPDNVEYLEFDAPELLKSLTPFLQKKSVAKDIVSKSLRISFVDEVRVKLELCDAVSLMCAIVSAKGNKFPDYRIVDVNTFYRVARVHKSKMYLIHRNGEIYADFFGGEFYIPTYKVSADIYSGFSSRLGTGTLKYKENIQNLSLAIQSLYPIVSINDSNNMSYIFIDQGGVYASNGIVVGKVSSKFFDLTIRQSDVSLIQSVLEIMKDSEVSYVEFDNFGVISNQKFEYTFPKKIERIPDQFKNAFVSSSCSYYVNVGRINEILSVVSGVDETSGVIDLHFKKDSLIGEFKVRRGDVSTFKLTEQVEGASNEYIFNVSIKILSVITKVFRTDAFISVSFTNDRVCFKAGDKECVVIVKR